MGCGVPIVIEDNTRRGNNETFEKKRFIGKGNLGEVYLVKSTKTKLEYALKEIKIRNPNAKMVEIEADSLNELDHPNIIYFKNAFITNSENILNIMSEFVENGDLSKELSEHHQKNMYFVENQIIDWLYQNCMTLVYLHEKKIIHGDIKPSNIFLTKNNSIKLGDFGNFKKALNLEYNNPYLPPEYIEKKEYSYAGDIWSLGVTFCHLITLEFPFEGNNSNEIYENIKKGNKNRNILNQEKDDYNKTISDIYNKELLDLIDEMMSLDPAQRPMAQDILRKNIIKNRMNKFLEENNYDDKKNKEVCESIKKYNDNLEKKRLKRKESEIVLDVEKSVKNNEMYYYNLADTKENKRNYDLLRQMSMMFDQATKNNK